IKTLDTHKRANWVDLHNLRMIKYGSVLHFDCHLTVPWYFNVYQAHAEVSALEGLIDQNFPQSIEMFVHTDGCIQPHSCRICPLADCPVRSAPFEGRLTWTLENVTSNQKHGMEVT
ncbi:MAG TPA: cation transporter dimerization domain-containing protein, partial [Saprospiraceae bacterium]|nr:cation transporter dimerization domain-containing protein [Saprospiraceae bacterium]